MFNDPTAAVAQNRHAASQIAGFSGIAGPFPTRASVVHKLILGVRKSQGGMQNDMAPNVSMQ